MHQTKKILKQKSNCKTRNKNGLFIKITCKTLTERYIIPLSDIKINILEDTELFYESPTAKKLPNFLEINDEKNNNFEGGRQDTRVLAQYKYRFLEISAMNKVTSPL